MFLFSHGNVDTSSAIQFSFVFGLIGFIPFLLLLCGLFIIPNLLSLSYSFVVMSQLNILNKFKRVKIKLSQHILSCVQYQQFDLSILHVHEIEY